MFKNCYNKCFISVSQYHFNEKHYYIIITLYTVIIRISNKSNVLQMFDFNTQNTFNITCVQNNTCKKYDKQN